MNILDVIMNAQNGAPVRQIGSQVGLREEQTASALSALVPALAAGLQREAQSPDGLAGLLSALSSGGHQRYLDNPGTLADPAAVADGNGILGHIFGSKDVSRTVASRAAAQSGISADVMKRLLPLAAGLMMAALSRQKATGVTPTGAGLGGGGGLTDMLSVLVDQDRDGSIVDDLGGMIGRAFGRS
jgi:hypothetical protein